MELVTAEQMKALDRLSIDKFKIPSLTLMERAGEGIAVKVKEMLNPPAGIGVVLGKGNNAGDGLVAARYLSQWGYKVTLFLLEPPSSMSGDALENWKALARYKPDIVEFFDLQKIKENAARLKESKIIIDAIFGTGLNSELKGKYRAAVEALNSSMRPVVAADIPSGLSADTGMPLGVAVRARVTVTFGLPKLGLVLSPGAEYAKEIKVIDIGIPKAALDEIRITYNLSTPDLFKDIFAPRERDTHKGTYGHVLVIAGSSGKMGAGLLTSRAALRSGAGLVTYALPNLAFTKYDSRFPEVMVEGVPDGNRGFFGGQSLPAINKLLAQKDVVAIGPGIGTNDETKAVVIEVISKVGKTCIMDADALNCIADRPSVLTKKRAPVVITPHPGEMGRLMGVSAKDVQKDRLGFAQKFARSFNVYVVLKGYRTVISTPEGRIYINPTGNPGMATAGMGDALTGMIAGLIAQGVSIEKALVAAVYIHGMAGDMAAEKAGEMGLLATDVIENIPKAIKVLGTVPGV